MHAAWRVAALVAAEAYLDFIERNAVTTLAHGHPQNRAQ
jgi:hypothetical protein